MLTPAETFAHIILHQTTKELMPFLLSLDKKDLVPVRQQTLRLKKELEEYRNHEVKPGKMEWKSLITAEQSAMLFLAGLATYSRKEALSRNFQLWFLRQLELPESWTAASEPPAFLTIMAHARPAWLGEWLVRHTRANLWLAPHYRLLRELERRELLEYDTWLYAQSVAHLLIQYNWRRNGVKGGDITNYDQLILRDLRADATLLTRDLPLLFDFDTMADTAGTSSGKERTAVSWLTLVPQLVASGHLDRADVLTRCLLALRRDFRRPLLTWFKSLFGSLQPTAAERLARQQELLELLHHPLPLVVNFALEQLKDLWGNPEFDTATLLGYADGLMTRQDLKTGLKTLLSAFAKLLKAQPAQAPILAQLYATALAHTDAAVQERAAKGLAELLGAKKPLLATAATAETIATLSSYADLLAPAARTALAPWLAAAPAVGPAAAAAAGYAPQSGFCPELLPATAVVPVADWHELLFLTGQVLKHDDPAALERWLDGLLRLQPSFPADYTAALRPYALQLLPYLEGDKVTDWLAQQAHAGDRGGYAGLVQALLLSWANGFATPFVARVPLTQTYAVADPLVALEHQRLAFAEQLLRARRALPLLSTPTHAPHWVAPRVLVERLLAYEAARQEPSPADLTLALARLAHADPTDAAAAWAQLPQLHHAGLRELLTWFLAPAPMPLPAAVTGRDSLFDKFKSVWAQLRPDSTAPATLAEALPQLWAVAARTKQPTATYPELHGLTLNECPNVGQPWHPRWELQPKSRTYREQWKPGKPEVTERWTELNIWTGPKGGAAASSLLLYSLHAAYRPPHGESHHSWRHIGPLAADYPFLAALLPQYPAPLYWHTLRLAATRDTVDSTNRTVFSQAMRSLLTPGPTFDEPTSLVLAIGLTHNASAVRALALEVLLAAIAYGRLVPAALGAALGRLLAADFVPVQRLAEGLTQARAISPRADDALRQLLEALLPALPPAPLRNLRKLLDAYADLLGRAPQTVPAAVRTQLLGWQAAAPALKKVSTALLT
jgi:hypothetical protein